MADQVSAGAGSSPLSGAARHRSRRGIVVRGFPPQSTDQETLEVAFYKAVKGELRCGVPEISSCQFTDDMQQAYVEFVDPNSEYFQWLLSQWYIPQVFF